MMKIRIEHDEVIINNKKYSIKENNKIRIGLRTYNIKHGILFYKDNIVEEVGFLGLHPKTVKTTKQDQLLFDILEILEESGAKPVCYLQNNFSWYRYIIKYKYNENAIKIEKETKTRINIIYFGKNITAKLSISSAPISEVEELHAGYIKIGPFTQMMHYDSQTKTIYFTQNIPSLGSKISIKQLFENIRLFDNMIWPGTNIRFYAKSKEYPEIIRENNIIKGKPLFQTKEEKIVHNHNTLYITTLGGYPIATLFSTKREFTPVEYKNHRIKIKIDDYIISICYTKTISSILKNYEIATRLAENEDIYDEFHIFDV